MVLTRGKHVRSSVIHVYLSWNIMLLLIKGVIVIKVDRLQTV